MAAKFSDQLAKWLGIVLVIIGMCAAAIVWASAEHDKIEAQCESRVLRYEDRAADSLRRLERKVDFLIERLIPSEP